MRKIGRVGVVGVPGAIKAARRRVFPLVVKLDTAVRISRQREWRSEFSVEANSGDGHGIGNVGLVSTALLPLLDEHLEPAPWFE